MTELSVWAQRRHDASKLILIHTSVGLHLEAFVEETAHRGRGTIIVSLVSACCFTHYEKRTRTVYPGRLEETYWACLNCHGRHKHSPLLDPSFLVTALVARTGDHEYIARFRGACESLVARETDPLIAISHVDDILHTLNHYVGTRGWRGKRGMDVQPLLGTPPEVAIPPAMV